MTCKSDSNKQMRPLCLISLSSVHCKNYDVLKVSQLILYILGEVGLVAGGTLLFSSYLDNFEIFSPLGGCNYKVRKKTLKLYYVI